MDRQNQSFETHQVSSAEKELPISPEFRQEPQVALSEVRLLKLIMRWTLLLGVMIGSFLTLFGIEVFQAQLQISNALIARLFGPLAMISIGAVLFLQWRIQRLRSQLPALQQTTGGPFQPLSGLMGIGLIGIAVFALMTPFLSPDVAIPVIEYGGLGMLFLIMGITLYFSIRNSS